MIMILPSFAKKAIVTSVAVILFLTILEFPAPIGLETRPQTDVSPVWLVFFIAILAVEIAVIPLIYRRLRLGAEIGMLAAVLNIFQVMADQLHLMQPEAAPFGYTLLELAVAAASITLAFFSWVVIESDRKSRRVLSNKEVRFPQKRIVGNSRKE